MMSSGIYIHVLTVVVNILTVSHSCSLKLRSFNIHQFLVLAKFLSIMQPINAIRPSSLRFYFSSGQEESLGMRLLATCSLIPMSSARGMQDWE